MSHTPNVPAGPTPPEKPGSDPIGLEYFDTTVGVPLYWTGLDWLEAGGAGSQIATVEFLGGSFMIDHALASPTVITCLHLTTSNGLPTVEDITVNVIDLGTGTAVAPGQYAAGPWSILIPSGSLDGSDHVLNFAHVQDPAEVPAIAPNVYAVLSIDSLTSLQTTLIGGWSQANFNLIEAGS